MFNTRSDSEKDFKKASSVIVCVVMVVATFAAIFAFASTNVVAVIQLDVTGADAAPPEGVFPQDNNITTLHLTLQPQDQAVSITSMTFDFTAGSTAADADIEKIFIFNDLDGEVDMDWSEVETSNFGVLSTVSSPSFPQLMTFSGYSVGPFSPKYVTVYIDVAAGTEGVTFGMEMTAIVCADPAPTITTPAGSETTVKTVIWSDEMESGQGSWTFSGGPTPLWHMDTYWSYVSESPATAWWYANVTEPDPSFVNTYYYSIGPIQGVRNYGNLTSGSIDLSGYSDPAMSFWQDLRTENQVGADEARFLVEDTSNPGVWVEQALWRTTGTDNWTKEYFDLAPYAGKTVRFRFYFDTIDFLNNLFRGWLIDRLYVYGAQEANDVSVGDFSAPNYALPTDNVNVAATIYNLGQSAETNGSNGVDAWLKIDGAYVQVDNIASIAQGGSQGVSFIWVPGATGDYNVCIEAWQVQGETNLGNNEACKTIGVRNVASKKISIVRSMGTKSGPVIGTWMDLNANWESYGVTPLEIEWKLLNKTSITYADIVATGADTLLISLSAQLGLAGAWSELSYAEIAAIKKYTVEGHGLVATGTTFYNSIPNNDALLDMFGVVNQTFNQTFPSEIDVNHESAGHPLLTNVAADPFVIGNNYSSVPDDDSTWDDPDMKPGSLGGTYVARSTGLSVALVEYKQLVYISWIPEWFGNTVDKQILYNSLAWSQYQIIAHDVSMSSIIGPDRVKPTPIMDITATLTNLASVDEDNNTAGIDIVLTEDGAVVDSTNIPTLGAGLNTPVTLQWDPPATPGTYNICMKAMQVVGEIDTSNNEVCKNIEVIDANIIIIMVLDSWGTDNAGLAPWDDLNLNWATYGPYQVLIDYTYLDKEDITALDLTYSSADILLISSSNSTGLSTSEFTNAEITAIQAYVNAGHGIMGTGTVLNTNFLINHGQLAPLFGIDGAQPYTDTSGVTDYQQIDTGHTVFCNIADPFTTASGISSTPGGALPDPAGWTAANLQTGAEYLGNSTPEPSAGAIVANDTGTYRGVYLSNAHEMSSNSDDKQILYNSMIWAAGKTCFPSLPPPPPTNLQISIVGPDLELDWTPGSAEPDVHFNVFRSMTVDGFTFGVPYDQTPSPPWTDPDPNEAADTNNYFYVVRAINITSGLTETNTNKVGKFYNQLHKGTNDISIPFELHDTTVGAVFGDISADINKVSVYDTATATWLSWVPMVGGPLTDVDNIKGIRVESDKNNLDFITVGRVPTSTPIVLTIGLDSWFFVGYPNLLDTPGALPDVLDNNGLAGLYLIVMYYDPTDRKMPWKWFDPNDPGGSPLQSIETGKGYWILMILGGTWTVPGE
ncbi:MAG: hypothetical protein KAR39_10990 [Thermoplasmata archaeon]|nr:hypothetical protein [Thermoplasmata archaeon]